MIRVCLDTNVIISGVVFGGKPGEILDQISAGKISLVLSWSILSEVAKVLEKTFNREEQEIIKIIKYLAQTGEVIKTRKRVRVIRHDPDNRVLECTSEGKVDYLVSGDKKHLLPLGNFEEIPIVSPDKFLRILKKASKN